MSDPVMSLAALPVVALDEPSLPTSGLLVPLTGECSKRMNRGAACLEHYRRLVAEADGTFTQCPFGFTSAVDRVGEKRFAVTGVVCFPRFGSKQEAKVAKRFPRSRVDRAAIAGTFDALRLADRRIRELEDRTIRQQSMALHEIRKLNRKVKQTAEKLCRQESPSDPDEASPELVRIYKASDLMSMQFEIIEILANESLLLLPLSGQSEIYRLFDKCARIYRGPGQKVLLDAPAGFSPKIAACEKTLPIIPSVLIENALKYSIDRGDVRIRFTDDTPEVFTVIVSNLASGAEDLTAAVFEKGVRGDTQHDGSGNGLYVAQLVAKQHGTAIRIETKQLRDQVMEVTLKVSFQKVP